MVQIIKSAYRININIRSEKEWASTEKISITIFVFTLFLLSGCGSDSQVISIAEKRVRDGLKYNVEQAKLGSKKRN